MHVACDMCESESEVTQSCPTLCDPMDCSQSGSSVHGIFQSTGVGCHILLQGILPTQGLNPGPPHCRQTLYHLSHQGSTNKSTKQPQRWFWLFLETRRRNEMVGFNYIISILFILLKKTDLKQIWQNVKHLFNLSMTLFPVCLKCFIIKHFSGKKSQSSLKSYLI